MLLRRWVHALGKRDHAFENEGFDASEKGVHAFQKWKSWF